MVKKRIKKLSKVLRIGLLSAVLMAIASYLFELAFINIIINTLLILGLSPIIVIFLERGKDEQERFYEVVTYLEQMIYSFLKFPKIREALLDVSEISRGRLKRTLNSALELIDDGNDTNIFKKAFNKMEQVYNCRHVFCLHKYLVKLETEGGEYEVFLNLILQDVKNWSNAVIEFRLDTEKKKRNVLFAIAVTVITSGIMVRLVPEEFSFVTMLVYKVVISVCLVLLYLVYFYIEYKSSKSWLDCYYEMTEKRVRKLDNIVYKGISLKEKTFSFILSILFIIIAVLLFVIGKKIIAYSCLLLGVYLYFRPKLKYRKVMRRMSSELQKSYSDWLLDFGMNLQSETVQTALYHSYKSAPTVLVPELERVLKLMVSHPISIKPYDAFLAKYELNEMKSSFRMLYPMQSLQHDQVIKHLELIVERSQRITRKSFLLQQEDKLGMINLLTAAPSLIGIFMILTSIFLLVTNFSNVLNNSMSGLSGILGG